MTDFAGVFVVLISMIGFLSIAALAISARIAGKGTSLENSARFPDAVEIRLDRSEAMALVRNALTSLNLSGVKYKVTEDDPLTGCMEAVASGILNGVPDNDVVDIAMSVVFTKVDERVTRIERNYIVRSLVDKDATIVMQQTNEAFDKLLKSLLDSPVPMPKRSESSKTRSISARPSQVKANVDPAPISEREKIENLEPELATLPATETAPYVVHSTPHAHASAEICSSCNYPLDAGFSFCLHCGK